MSKLQCELCGSVDIIKTEENVFQCQHCGCKYTLEQARSLIASGEVRTKATDFEIVGGVLKKYNGEAFDVVVPDNVIKIGEKAFYNLCIRRVKLSANVREIEEYAFANCCDLSVVQLSEGLTTIGNHAFENCTSIESFSFPKSIKTVCGEAFKGCSSLTTIRLKGINTNGVLDLSGCSSLRSVTVPDNVVIVRFTQCKSLKTLELPDTVVDTDCSECVSLKRIKLPNHRPQFTYGFSFKGCQSLADVYIPDSWAPSRKCYKLFEGCNLRTFSFPEDRWMKAGRCAYCGGEFQGIFKKTCILCNREKNY